MLIWDSETGDDAIKSVLANQLLNIIGAKVFWARIRLPFGQRVQLSLDVTAADSMNVKFVHQPECMI